MTGVGDYFGTAEAVPFHEAQWAKAQIALAIGKQEGTNLSGWKRLILSPEIGTLRLRSGAG